MINEQRSPAGTGVAGTPLTERLGSTLPADAESATLIGRVFDPEAGGPSVVVVRGDRLADISEDAATVSMLLERPDPLAVARGAGSARSWPLRDVLAATAAGGAGPRLLAPIDLQVIKAAGVTYVDSMLERVIEERAHGEPGRAAALREQLGKVIGGAISSVRPGSPEAARVKEALVAEGLWSQYLEVGIGPTPELFTKAPVLSAVGTGVPIGVLAASEWNNPEPELVLVADSAGRPRGAALGNDVNLRDLEGRSALLLGEAKDNNGSCAVGPFVRLFDERYTLDDARNTEIELRITGPDDGFELRGTNSVSRISRSLEELLGHVCGSHHQYPDGFVLFTGTLFAPTRDRGAPGQGFTHRPGDVVSISAPALGSLVNVVTTAEAAPPWKSGIAALFASLARRGLLQRLEAPGREA
jgi:fumarylacetoacetate (FAA) hydrolase family protein